jgi:hypothetical protein
MLEAMVPPSTSAGQGGGGGATAKEATPIPLKALNLIAMHPKIRLMEMVKVQVKYCTLIIVYASVNFNVAASFSQL